MIEKEKKLHVIIYMKSPEQERRIKHYMRRIKQTGVNLYTVLPDLVDDAFENYIKRNGIK